LMRFKISRLMRKIHFYVVSVKIQHKCVGFVLVLTASLVVLSEEHCMHWFN